MQKKKIITTTIILVVVLLGISAVAAFDINPFKKKQVENKDNYFTKTIEIAKAETGDIRNSIATKGSIALDKKIEINMPAKAKVEEVEVLAGARVKKGDVLVVLDINSLQDEYDRIYKEWTKEKSSLGDMKPSYDYVRIIATQKGKVTESNLVKNKMTDDILKEKEYLLVIDADNQKQVYAYNVPSGKISTVSYLSNKGRNVKAGDLMFVVKVANSSFENQVKKVEDLQKQLDVLKALISEPAIKSGFDAIVADVSAVSGKAYEKDATLVKCEPTDEFLVKLNITKEELQKVKLNQNAKIKLDSQTELQGVVQHISYSANDQGKFDMVVRLTDTSNAEPNDILPGLKAEVNIVLEEKLGVVKVPIDAIKTDNQGEYVLVFKGKEEDVKNYNVDTIPTEKRYVEKGLVTPLYAEIIDGVESGEKVVVVTVSKNENDYYGDMMGF